MILLTFVCSRSRMGMEEPIFQKTLERLDQENFYLSSKDYARFARETNDREKALVQRMGLKMQRSAAGVFYDVYRLIPDEVLVSCGEHPLAFGHHSLRSFRDTEQVLQLAFFQFEAFRFG